MKRKGHRDNAADRDVYGCVADWEDGAGVIVLANGECQLYSDCLGAQATAEDSTADRQAGSETLMKAASRLARGRLELKLPAFNRGVYYRAFQKYPEGRQLGSEDWLNGANRLQAQEFRVLANNGFAGLADGGLMMTLELTDGRYLTLLPLVSQRSAAWLSFEGEQLYISFGHMGTEEWEGREALPVLSYAIADQIYAANFEAWRTGLAHPLAGKTARLRSAKTYPDVFRYIGWCSWEEYFFTINEKKLLEVMDEIDASSIPIRYFLIDDGHQHHERSGELAHMELGNAVFEGMMQARLISFASNERFPNGWGPIMDRFKASSMRWIGLWLNFNGYWGGIHPDNELGMGDDLVTLEAGDHRYLLPREGVEHAYRFYHDYIAAQKRAGFDFLKIDQQAANLDKYRKGGAGNPVASAAGNARAMEAASVQQMEAHINCMAHNAVAIFNTRSSAVTRCSEDYKKGDRLWAKRHIHNSFATIPVLGHTVWGDHDMFHSNDPAAAESMSISKALSGGPVYLSDAPEQFRAEVIEPLIYADGELLRPLAPGVPLPDSILEDPVTSRLAYGVIAPLQNRTAAIAMFNLTEPAIPVSRDLSIDDYRWAGAMEQPAAMWEVPEEGLVLYDWHRRSAVLMNGPISCSLADFDARLFLMCPIRCGWALIGNPNKYLSAAAAEIMYADACELIVRTREPGEILFWSWSGLLSSTMGSLTQLDANLWSLRIDQLQQDERFAIRRLAGRESNGGVVQ